MEGEKARVSPVAHVGWVWHRPHTANTKHANPHLLWQSGLPFLHKLQAGKTPDASRIERGGLATELFCRVDRRLHSPPTEPRTNILRISRRTLHQDESTEEYIHAVFADTSREEPVPHIVRAEGYIRTPESNTNPGNLFQ
eukprot:1696969-Rhodomonas_salina.4